MFRVPLSFALLALQALGLGHALLSTHAWDEGGVAFERAALLPEAHEGDSHVCAERLPAEETDACAVLAVLQTPSLTVAAPRSWQLPPPQRASATTAPARGGAGRSLLFVAPKASPPA